MERRLQRSRRQRIVAGVAGGLGQYLSVDPLLVRLLFVVLTLTTGWGFVLYIVLWIALPEASAEMEVGQGYRGLDARERTLLFGGGLIVVGLVLLAQELGILWWLRWQRLWPLVLIAAGVALLVDRARGERRW